jgi:predicted DNA-binding transcriptional regulator AlpA
MSTKKPFVQAAKPAAAHKAATPNPPALRLLCKREVLAIVGATYPTIWEWMRAGKFPRGRIVGGKSKWRSDEIEQWLADLPLRPLKGDAEKAEAAMAETI